MTAHLASPRYVYVKNGDAVAQVSQVIGDNFPSTTSGPNAFIFDFLSRNRDSEILVVSRSDREVSYRSGKIGAEVFRDGQRAAEKAIRRTINFFRLLSLLVSKRPDRVICGCTGSQLLAVTIYGFIFRVPFIHSRHNRLAEDGESILRRMRTWVESVCMRRARAVICHGPYLAEQLKDLGIGPERIIDFDVSFEDLVQADGNSGAPGESTMAEPGDRRDIVFLGRLVVEKGVHELLAACEPLLRQDARLSLKYAGDGPDATKLQDEIRARGLDKQVLLLGRISRPEIVELLRRAYLVVTPTRSGFPEGRCMSAMEGMVFGVPVVAPNCGPFPFIVKHMLNGLLYTPDSVEDLRHSIHLLLDDQKIHSDLSVGALEFGKTISQTNRTFGEAVDRGFIAGH